MAKLNLGDFLLTTSPQRDRFAALRRRYIALGEEHATRFQSKFALCESVDDLFQMVPGELETILTATTTMIANDLAANGIFEVSENTIRSDLDARVALVAERFNVIQDRYFTILGKAAELEVHRKEALENRPHIVGGGLGVEGAAQGIVFAGVANAAIGLTLGLASLPAIVASQIGDRDKKRQLLADPTTRAGMVDFIRRIALQGGEFVAANVAGGSVFDSVSGDAHQKSMAIVENVSAGRVPENQVKPVLVQALIHDPFNVPAWTAWLERFGDPDGSIGASANVLGVGEVAIHKSKLVADRKATMAWSTPEECAENSILLGVYAQWLSLPFEAERSAIAARAVVLKLERRTFNGVEYPTLAAATQARLAHEDMMQRTVSGVIHDTLESASEARVQLREEAFAASRADSAIGWLTLGYRRFRQVKGRSSRKEFWMFVLSVLIVLIVLIVLSVLSSWVSSIAANIFLFYLLATLVPLLTLLVRRFHDQKRSGWYLLLNLIPYVGWIIVLGFMFVDGTPSDNKYGPNPKQTKGNAE